MKKCDLATLAMIGISAGLMVSGCQQKNGTNPSSNKASAAEQLSPDMQAFYSSLSPEAQQQFMQLDAQHKMMAVEMANQSCNHKNSCAGMGGCASVEHQCAGQNGCKGQGGAPVKNPNKAVEVQYKNQTSQRQSTNGGMNGSSGDSKPGSSQPSGYSSGPSS